MSFNKNYGRLLILFFVGFLYMDVNAQHDLRETVNRLTASPSVSALGTYGGMEARNCSGGVQENIDLFELQEGAIFYKPSVSCFSTGIKINDWGSRVGIGWAENFTATIHRTVKSAPDEFVSNRVQFNDYALTQQNLDRVRNLEFVGQNTGYDGEYDVFTYNIFGESGSFIIKDGVAKLLNHRDTVRVQMLSVSPTYQFCITNSNGFKFYFDSQIEYTTIDTENDCDQDTWQWPNIATAWFLSRIVSPRGDVLVFNYTTINTGYIYDFSQSYTLVNLQDSHCSIPQVTETYCARRKVTNTKVLSSVVGTGFTLAFEYNTRQDLLNEKLLIKIRLLDNNNNPVEEASFTYREITATSAIETLLNLRLDPSEENGLRKRYFLDVINIGSSAHPANKVYKFSYVNPELLPHRFSFSQDLFGYYNGKGNAGLVPAGKVNALLQAASPPLILTDLGNRTPDPVSNTGLLNKIIYPTGGSDSILYEQNTYTGTVVDRQSDNMDGVYINPYSEWELITEAFLLPVNDKATIRVGCDYNAVDLPDEPGLYYLDCALYDVNTNMPVFGSERHLALTEHFTAQIDIVAGHSYEWHFNFVGVKTLADYHINYATSITTSSAEFPYYGQRVKKVISNPLHGLPVTRSFGYKSFEKVGQNLVYSDQTSISTSVNDAFASSFISASLDNCGGPLEYYEVQYYVLKSKNTHQDDVFDGLPHAYSCITEFLDDAGTSYIAHEFNVDPSQTAGSITIDYDQRHWPVYIPLGNTNWDQGIEFRRTYGSYSNANYVIAKQQRWNYSNSGDPQIFDNHVVYRVEPNRGSFTNPASNFYPYVLVHYVNIGTWYKLNSMVETDYVGPGGTAIVVQTTTSYNYNVKDELLSDEEVYNSKGEKLTTHTNRPQDMVDGGRDPNGVYQAMLNGFILSPKVDVLRLKNISQVSLTRTNYYSPFSGLFMPGTIEMQTLNNPAEARARYHNYDNKGNPLCLSKENDTKACYVWGYGGRYVIAKIENADYATVEDILGGVAAVESFRNIVNPDNNQVLSFLNALRTDARLSTAQVNMYTYAPLVGMTGHYDTNGRATNYEYDDLRRLQLIRDKDGNIIKKMDYKYQTIP